MLRIIEYIWAGFFLTLDSIWSPYKVKHEKSKLAKKKLTVWKACVKWPQFYSHKYRNRQSATTSHHGQGQFLIFVFCQSGFVKSSKRGIIVCLFVQGLDSSMASRIESVPAEFPWILMRHESIEWSEPTFSKPRTPSTIISDVKTGRAKRSQF